MNTAFQNEEKIHLGYNVQRIREIIGKKQYTLAEDCGWSQQQMSKLEQTELIDDVTLEPIARSLGVTTDFIKNFKEEKAIYNIQNNSDLHDNASPINHAHNSSFTYDAADKIVSLLEKFIQEDKAKTEFIANLSKAVLDLADEVKKLNRHK
ncbi:helix-turn-helix domain-containing protein [Olivibacter oleidegradans]|uniref:Helix-turn-helix domain-containing protein n=1 Tax=Olivibacter oleidegradans TaxID=760123 RepID=A0ABV6HMU0_9SPHI